MKIDDKRLNSVAGGKTVETKDGKWLVIPDDALIFDNEEQAKGAEMAFQHLGKQRGKGNRHLMDKGRSNIGDSHIPMDSNKVDSKDNIQ